MVLVMPQQNELPPVTPGVRTSEFILALFIVALCVAGVARGKVPCSYSAFLVALIGVAYPVLRNGLKQRHLEWFGSLRFPECAVRQRQRAEVENRPAALLSNQLRAGAIYGRSTSTIRASTRPSPPSRTLQRP